MFKNNPDDVMLMSSGLSWLWLETTQSVFKPKEFEQSACLPDRKGQTKLHSHSSCVVGNVRSSVLGL